jgi:TetR/AcrR family transcriptional regulator, repressor for neighboring sulfatase
MGLGLRVPARRVRAGGLVSERRPGREGAVEALVEAARALFVEYGPSAVSLRDIARRAGVNHGLIHHYIGTREDLLHLVFSRSTDHARQEIADAADPVDALRTLRAVGGTSDDYTRLLAWALLDQRDPAAFHGRSSALDAVVATAGGDSRQLRVALAMAVVQTLGWKLFGGYALAAAGLDAEDPEAISRDIERLVDRIVTDAAGVCR